MKISFYKNTFTVDEKADVNIEHVINGIRDGRWKEKIGALRKLDGEEYTKQKELLPAATFSGTFKKRIDSEIDEYSGIVALDVDHLDELLIKALKERLATNPHIYFAFVSPGGKGMKILFRVSSSKEDHLAAFNNLKDFCEAAYAIRVDPSGKNISRLCYVSYDPDAVYHGLETEIFHPDLEKYREKKHVIGKNEETEDDRKYKLCVSWIEKHFSYVPGSRNAYIHALACAMNRVGVPFDSLLQVVYKNYDLPQKELFKACKSAYFHNQAQHNTVEIKDVGIQEFTAPPYVANYTEDVVTNDIMRITAMLYYKKLEAKEIKDIIAKVAKYYRLEGVLDINRKGLHELMNQAIESLNNKVADDSEKFSLKYKTAEMMAETIINFKIDQRAVSTTIPVVDAALRGGLMPGNFYGLIGHGQTFKSILSQYISQKAAIEKKAVLYLNGEMSEFQFYERLVQNLLHRNLYLELSQGKITPSNAAELMAQTKAILNNNLFVVSSIGFDKDNVLATINNIQAREGKKIDLVVIDGITQMNSERMEEIPGTIKNSFKCKEIAKNANGGEGVAVLGLLHISGNSPKHYRDTGSIVRGGQKVLANMDGYFSTSLLIDPKTNDLVNDDIIYREGVFYLRFTDKRSAGGVVNAIINVNDNLDLEQEPGTPSDHEVKVLKTL